MTEQPVYIVGSRYQGGPLPVAGARVLDCERCSKPTIFSPSSLTRPEAAVGTFICWPCSECMQQQGGGAMFNLALTDAQRVEIRAAGIDPAEAQAALRAMLEGKR